MQAETPDQAVRTLFCALLNAFGPQHWWPARTAFEVILGSILVQNTAWTNAERALARLRAAHALNTRAMRQMPLAQLEQLIRPAGFFRQKSRTIKAFVAFSDQEYGGSLIRMSHQKTDLLRRQLLGIIGIGPETADSILLYAFQQPVFVVDAYARRVLSRHKLVSNNASYQEIHTLVSTALAGYRIAFANPPTHASDNHRPTAMSRRRRSQDTDAYGEMHGLLVAIGKRFCRKTAPDCARCPLQPLLPASRQD